MLDVHQQQLLVLLLVVDARARRGAADVGVGPAVEQLGHGIVDVARGTRRSPRRRAGRSGPRSARRMAGADRLVVRVEQVAVGRVERLGSRRASAPSTKVSKNQVVWARCHLVGLTSGIDWTVWSSGDSGAASASVSARVAKNRSVRVRASAASVDRSSPLLPVCGGDRRRSAGLPSALGRELTRKSSDQAWPGIVSPATGSVRAWVGPVPGPGSSQAAKGPGRPPHPEGCSPGSGSARGRVRMICTDATTRTTR